MEQQQTSENGAAPSVTEQPTQPDKAISNEQPPVDNNAISHEQQQQQQQPPTQDNYNNNNTAAFAPSLPQDHSNGIAPPTQQQHNDPNGLNLSLGLGLGLGQFDPNGLILPTQGMNFGATTNGMAFPDPSMMMMAAGQPLAMDAISAQHTNGIDTDLSAGRCQS